MTLVSMYKNEFRNSIRGVANFFVASLANNPAMSENCFLNLTWQELRNFSSFALPFQTVLGKLLLELNLKEIKKFIFKIYFCFFNCDAIVCVLLLKRRSFLVVFLSFGSHLKFILQRIKYFKENVWEKVDSSGLPAVTRV